MKHVLITAIALTASLSSAQTELQAEAQAAAQTEQTPAQKSPILRGTAISGNIRGFLRASESPYLVTGDLLVDKASALVIEPGVILQFTPGSKLKVEGQIVAAGISTEAVVFKSAARTPKAGDWKGITISGENGSELRNAVITDAENGVVIENTGLNLHGSSIKNSTGRGLYIRNGKAEITDCEFTDNQGAALHVSNYGEASLDNVVFKKNTVAIYNSNLGYIDASGTTIQENGYGILDMGNSHLTLKNSDISKNTVGASAADVLDNSVSESISGNANDFTVDSRTVAGALSEDPQIFGIKKRITDPDEKIGNLIKSREKESALQDSTAKSWNIIGNVMLGGNYHHVITGKSYENTFQVPGFGAEASAYLLMQSPDGRTIEFNADLSADSWSHFSPNPVTLSYTDQVNHLVLGDFQKSQGDIYMSNLPIFGVGYTMSLLRNNADMPLFELGGFFGEARRPYAWNDRHPLIYKEYIEDGELQAQRLAYGASFKWAPVRRFDATVGIIYANDEMEDPLLRDGSSRSTGEPMQTSFTMYADGNWLFYPGDIELNGSVAVGRADTADVAKERAANKVFSEAGLNVSSMGTLRQLMNNESRIRTLSDQELYNIFGDNTTLTRSQMRDSLRTLIRDAKLAKREEDSDIEDSRVMGLNWGSQNFAIGASLDWSIYKTTISAHVKYVGEDFYSAGSPDQLSDTREFGGRIEQEIRDYWTLGFAYQINVENAANHGNTNLFGLGEGTRWGFFDEASDSWQEEHELDNDRTKYIQNFSLENTFKISNNISTRLNYNLEYRTQYRPYQLQVNQFYKDGVFLDDWFAPRKGKKTIELTDNENSTTVDAERWAQYTGYAIEDYLASNFQERIFRHTWAADVSLKQGKSIVKVGGVLSIRSDYSKFYKDSLANLLDLADSTWGKMGYYFGGADYLEHTYPLSWTLETDLLQNSLIVRPRFKNYTRDEMKESEINVDEEMTIPLMNKFLTLGINGEFRYLLTTWEDDGEQDETEMDILGGLNVKVNHTKHWSSEWFAGTAMYLRPDSKRDEYTDIYGGIRVNYIF
ncbi:copper-binding protein (NosD) [Fibrobacter sp. UWH5]|uniref:right-handed parallel beta-helix repeat-containing protein n=1 Tax=Fibrobacter sp. UWH5 TaxID=1896211 RepID=UPI00091B748A|nr:right-handed parallel beta-helix repeat-containing protein [Fibrobacter sp. UWH5]SHK55834.1 copper-binding protein (NosD) [Fibrobacter sp. UWH5]